MKTQKLPAPSAKENDTLSITINVDKRSFCWLEQEALEKGFTIEHQAAVSLDNHIQRVKRLRGDPLQFIEEHVHEIQAGVHRLQYPQGRTG
jgi:hypothetical protein